MSSGELDGATARELPCSPGVPASPGSRRACSQPACPQPAFPQPASGLAVGPRAGERALRTLGVALGPLVRQVNPNSDPSPKP